MAERLRCSEIKNICEMYNRGMAYKEIAEKSGRSHTAIRKAVEYGNTAGLIYWFRRPKAHKMKDMQDECKFAPVDWDKFNPGMCTVR